MPRAPVRPWPRLSARERERLFVQTSSLPLPRRGGVAGARAGRPAAAEVAEEGREEEEEDRRRDETERAGNKRDHRRLLPLRRAVRELRLDQGAAELVVLAFVHETQQGVRAVPRPRRQEDRRAEQVRGSFRRPHPHDGRQCHRQAGEDGGHRPARGQRRRGGRLPPCLLLAAGRGPTEVDSAPLLAWHPSRCQPHRAAAVRRKSCEVGRTLQRRVEEAEERRAVKRSDKQRAARS
mmetsp:Transcript_42416/g.137623  ORF Transcript_42416/g.137623 Transcript_42416/m.137623 type:complete len:236 (+) Transcript_42416:494-1201(+)